MITKEDKARVVSDRNTMRTIAEGQGDIYTQLRHKCIDRHISISKAIEEAIRLWLKKS